MTRSKCWMIEIVGWVVGHASVPKPRGSLTRLCGRQKWKGAVVSLTHAGMPSWFSRV
jgi:hypothetical protein